VYSIDLTEELHGVPTLPRKYDEFVTRNPHLPVHGSPDIYGVIDKVVWDFSSTSIIVMAHEVTSLEP